MLPLQLPQRSNGEFDVRNNISAMGWYPFKTLFSNKRYNMYCKDNIIFF